MRANSMESQLSGYMGEARSQATPRVRKLLANFTNLQMYDLYEFDELTSRNELHESYEFPIVWILQNV
jgi:hypothetical protein